MKLLRKNGCEVPIRLGGLFAGRHCSVKVSAPLASRLEAGRDLLIHTFMGPELALAAALASPEFMDGETITGSLDRIEAALQRIEAAARETENQARVTIESDSDLEQRHEDLRAAVTNALARLDTLLAEQEQ